jgi:hypothetical protein
MSPPSCIDGSFRPLLRRRFVDQGLKELAGGVGAPVAGALDAAEETALAVDEIGGRRTPDAVELAGHVAGGVEEHGRDVAAFLGGLPDGLRALAEADEQNLEPLTLELLVQPIDGR